MPALVTMEGLPGSGKSTLAPRLDGEFVPEEAIFEAPEFEEVGRAFKAQDWPTPELMLNAYRRLFAGRSDTLVFDWNVVGMIEDLPCAQRDRGAPTSNDPSAMPDVAVLTRHARDVHELCGGRATLLVLEIVTVTAVRRAAAERGEAWVSRESARGDARSLEDIAAFYDRFAARRLGIIAAHRNAGWRVVSIDANGDAQRVVSDARRLLA